MAFLVGAFVKQASKANLLVQMLLVIAFCALATASSMINTGSLPADIELTESSANTSLVLEYLNLLHARADTSLRPKVVFQSTCSNDQIAYLQTAMRDAADLVCSHLDQKS
jgi:hypothetical protein